MPISGCAEGRFGSLGTYKFIYGEGDTVTRDVVMRGELIGKNHESIPFSFVHTKGMRYNVDDRISKKKRLGQLGLWAREQMRAAQKELSSNRITGITSTDDEGVDTILKAVNYTLR